MSPWKTSRTLKLNNPGIARADITIEKVEIGLGHAKKTLHTLEH
jgi:hypothetical protein